MDLDRRVNFRISEDLDRRMKREKGINWSQYLRDMIRARLEELDAGLTYRKVQRLVERYEKDLRRTWILHMFACGIDKRHIYETAEALFEEEHDATVDMVQDDLRESSLLPVWKRIDVGLQVKEVLLGEIREGPIRQIREEIIDNRAQRFQERNLVEGVELLASFARLSNMAERAFLRPEGFERTWELLTGEDHDIDELLWTGLIYKDRYESNAYSYRQYVVPGYGLGMMRRMREDVQFRDMPAYSSEILQLRPEDVDLVKLLRSENPDVRSLLAWIGGSKKYVAAHNESDQILAELDEKNLDLDKEAFDRALERAVEKRLIIIDYAPPRKSTSGRDSRPAQWIYRISPAALEELPDALLNVMGDGK